jgi:hypothetical protein
LLLALVALAALRLRQATQMATLERLAGIQPWADGLRREAMLALEELQVEGRQARLGLTPI